MKQPPFKLKGIYARKLDPKKDLINYKQSKIGSIWKAALGEKEEPFYEILWFSRKWDFKNQKLGNYSVAYAIMTGEIFDLSDWNKTTGGSSKYGNVIFEEDKFEFSDKETVFSGYLFEDLLLLTVLNKKTGISESNTLRYVPWK
jgi:hypothetical protein